MEEAVLVEGFPKARTVKISKTESYIHSDSKSSSGAASLARSISVLDIPYDLLQRNCVSPEDECFKSSISGAVGLGCGVIKSALPSFCTVV